MKLPKIVSSVLCEDIRMEFSGKFSLAGVFGSDMTVFEFPASILCAVFAEMEPLETGSAPVEFRATDGAGAEVMKIPHQLNVESPMRQPLAIGPFNFLATGPGEVKIQWRLAEGRWVTIKSFKIMLPPQNPSPGMPKNFAELIMGFEHSRVKEGG